MTQIINIPEDRKDVIEKFERYLLDNNILYEVEIGTKKDNIIVDRTQIIDIDKFVNIFKELFDDEESLEMFKNDNIEEYIIEIEKA